MKFLMNDVDCACLGKHFLSSHLMSVPNTIWIKVCDFAAQDKSPFCIFHIMNEIWLNQELIHRFLVGNHSPIF